MWTDLGPRFSNWKKEFDMIQCGSHSISGFLYAVKFLVDELALIDCPVSNNDFTLLSFKASVLSSERSLPRFAIGRSLSHLKNHMICWLDMKTISSTLTLLLTPWLQLQIVSNKRHNNSGPNCSSTCNNSDLSKSSDPFHSKTQKIAPDHPRFNSNTNAPSWVLLGPSRLQRQMSVL